jgi:AAA domain
MTQNPFVVGEPVPPERFFGRRDEIATAFDQIYHSGNLAIWGGPGMGKSSFLDKLAAPEVLENYLKNLPQSPIAVRLNCEVIDPFAPCDFWREILKILREHLATEPTLQAEINIILATEATKRDSLQTVLGKLGQQNKFLLLLVDNYDHALRKNEQYTEAHMDAFLKDCRYLANASAERRYLSMVVTSLKRLSQLEFKQDPGASPWFNHYLFQPLKLFPQREVDQILKQNIPNITPQLQEAIREITGGHPYLLQIAGFFICRKLRSTNTLNVQEFIDEFADSTTQIFKSMWDRCSEVEQSLLMLMALYGVNGRLHKRFHFDLSGIDFIFTQRERELTSLREQGVIIRKENPNGKPGSTEYVFTSSIMERWVMQEIWNSDDPTLKEREKVFLNLMNNNQAKKVTTAMEWLWKNKNQVPSILEWFGNITGAI